MKKKSGSPGKAGRNPRDSVISWKDVFNAIENPLMVLDYKHRILFANHAMAGLTDVKKERLPGKKCYEVLHKTPEPVPGCPMAASLAAGKKEPVATEIVVNSRIYLISCTPVHVATSTLPYYVHLVTDITRQKQAELAANELAQRYRLISEQLPCSFWSTDRELRYTSSAGAGLKKIGLEPGQVIGKTICEMYEDQPGKEKALAAYRRALAGEPQTYEAWYRDRQFLTSIEPFRDENNEIVGTLGVAYDTTEQKHVQYVLEQVNRKNTLLNSITRHDAGNQISALMAYVDLLREDMPSPEARAHIDKISTIVDQLAELIEFTQAYQNLGLKNPQWQDVAALLNKLQAGQVKIVNTTGGLSLFADPLLEHVFVNLLDNTVRHGKHATTITVTGRETSSGLIVTWEDDGIGVPAEEKEKIFERGFGKHTGLGLFLIREILSITGMTIRETGIPGKGAKFEILAPTGTYGFLKSS